LTPLGYLRVKRKSVNDLVPGTFVFWPYESSSILASWLAGSRIHLKPVVARSRAAASCNSPTGQEKSCFLREPVEPRTPLLLIPGKRQNGIRPVERFQGILNRAMSRWPTIQAPVSPVCRSAMPHRAAPSIYALSFGDARGNRARELLVWRAYFPVRALAMVVFRAPED
jgi:hypothetical protein